MNTFRSLVAALALTLSLGALTPAAYACGGYGELSPEARRDLAVRATVARLFGGSAWEQITPLAIDDEHAFVRVAFARSYDGTATARFVRLTSRAGVWSIVSVSDPVRVDWS